MPRRGSFSDSEDDVALQEANKLLADEDRRLSVDSSAAVSGSGRRGLGTPSAGPAASPRVLLASYVATVLLSTWSTRRLARLARYSRLATIAFPLTHFATLSAIVFALGFVRQRGTFGAAAGWGGQGGPAGGGRMAWLAGAASASGLVLRLWEMRLGEQRLCEALEIFTLPTLLALLPYALSKLHSTSHTASSPSTSLMTACAVAAFLVGFALIGVPAGGAGLALALFRLPVEAAVLLLLKAGMSSEGQAGGFLKKAALVQFLRAFFPLFPFNADMLLSQAATTTSLVMIPFSNLVSSPLPDTTLDRSAYTALLSTLFLTVATETASLLTLYSFSSAVTIVTALFPRNLFLLIGSTLGREGFALTENWVQVVTVYAISSVAVPWTDPEVAAAVKSLKNSGEGSHYLPTNHDSHPSSPTLSTRSTRPPLLALIPFIPLLIYLITTPATTSSLSAACSYLPPSVRFTVCPTASAAPTSRTVDLVVSYYDERLDWTKFHIEDILKTKFVSERSSRVVIYNKGPRTEKEIREGLDLRLVDDVVPLPNLGREGATYLKHILLHYNATVAALTPHYQPAKSASLATTLAQLRTSTLADHTYFLQPHLAWADVAKPRLEIIEADTGFAHLGPYVPSECGYDVKVDTGFPIVKELYNIFTGEICSPGGQTSAWSAQMVVSKRRILANPYIKYAKVDELIEAPEGHWVHNMWGPNESGGPSNPAFGHSVERAWPMIFNCWDARLAKECPDEVAVKEKCQCLDS
ncbi:hypothetical protein JCM11251_003222 [Rhodosporidiobolus azoricus]